MAIEEQRLSALEQSIRDINYNETILLGMAMKQEENIRGIKLNLASLSEHVDIFERSVNSCFETQGKMLDIQGKQLDSQGKQLDSQSKMLDSQGEQLNSQGEQLDSQGKQLNSQGKQLDSQGKMLDIQGEQLNSQDKKLDQILLVLNTLISKPE